MRPLHLAMLLGLFGFCAAGRSTSAAPTRPAKRTPFTPSVPPAERKPEARSTIPVLFGLELAWAKDQLQQRIPERLQGERGREVAPGLSLDVQVTRRDLKLRSSSDRVGVSTDLLLDLDVRTRWGSFGGRLGSCRAVVAVDVDLSLRLSPEGKLSAPAANATIREPCRLSGFDLTPIIQREIEQRLAAAREQAQKQLDLVNLQLAEVSREVARRAAQPVSGCLTFLPDKLLQGPIESDGSDASMWLALNGRVIDDCSVKSPSVLVFEGVDAAPRFDFRSSDRISLSEFGDGLARHLDSSGVRAKILALRTAHLDERDHLAIRVRTQQVTDWIVARAEIRESSVRLVALQSKSRRLLEALGAALESYSWSVRPDASDVLSEQLASMAREYSLVLGSSEELKQRQLIALSELVTSSELELDPDGLVVVRRHRSRLAP